jgi:predicted metal-binding membrane protein
MNDLSFHPVPAGALPRFRRFFLLGEIALLAGLAWLLLLPGISPLSHTHAGSPGLGAFTLSAAAWFVMMVAMMLPPVVPWLLLVASGARRESCWPYTVGLFAAGYFAIWLGYSVAAAGIQVSLVYLGLLGHELSLDPRTGGAVLVTAGLFQLSPLKHTCLTHCRNPIGYFLRRWHDGPMGAMRMGATHGIYCVACCWALMAVAFALGIMNIRWMAALTAMLVLEKIAPGGRQFGVLFGLFLAVWGAFRLLT